MTIDHDQTTSALSTKVEEEFISPLTVIRGALEILRDFPDLPDPQRTEFISRALGECDRLKSGIDNLAASVYAAARREEGPQIDARYADRIKVDTDGGIIDLDFSNFQFKNSDIVNAFYDAIDSVVIPSDRKWVFLVNFRNCQTWPEAWVAYAHRSKKITVNFSEVTIRYSEGEGEDINSDPDILPSRAAALAEARRITSH